MHNFVNKENLPSISSNPRFSTFIIYQFLFLFPEIHVEFSMKPVYMLKLRVTVLHVITAGSMEENFYNIRAKKIQAF